MYFANIRYANSNIRNVLFYKFDTAFYVSQVFPMFKSCIEELYITHRVWRVPWVTHCKLLPHTANCIHIKLCFSRRCMRFIKMAINSCNIVVKTITNMGINGLYSEMGANKRFLQSKLYIEEMNV